MEIRTEARRFYLAADGDTTADEDVVQFHEYAATAGDPGSQTALGDLYLMGGHGLKRSLERAFHYYSMAAAQDSRRGIAMLGFMYEKGYGVAQSNATALKMYKQAAERQDTFGMARLAKAHLQARLGLDTDVAAAEDLYARASALGDRSALAGLGLIARMRGDMQKATKFFGLAVQKGQRAAAWELARLQLSDPATCALALRNLFAVIQWSDPVVKGLKEARALVRGPRPDYEGALRIYTQLAWAGVEEAQANAAHILHKELNRSQESILYYQLSAEANNHHSHLVLGDMLYEAKDLNMSLTAYRRASDLRNHEAMYNLGYMYERGEGVPQPDAHLAKRFYDMALATNPDALYAVYLSLAHLYLTTMQPSALLESIDIWSFYNDTIAITLLVMLLVGLLIARAR